MSKRNRERVAKAVQDPVTSASNDIDPAALHDLGGPGYKRYSGVVSDEFHANLKGRLAMRVYREMLSNDPLLGGAFRGMKQLIRQAEWLSNPADVKKAVDAGVGDAATLEAEAVRWAERLHETMYDMEVSWRHCVDEMLSAFPYGFALLWIKYKIRRGENESRLLDSQYDDGLYGWRELQIRRQETIEKWVYDQGGYGDNLLGVEQLPPPTHKRVFLPIDRLVHVRFDSAGGNPEGYSGFRNSYRPYFFGNLKEGIEGTGIERDLSGYPVLQVPKQLLHPSASASERAQAAWAKSIVRKVKRDELEGAVVPSEIGPDNKPTGWKFGLMSSGGSRAININESIVRNRVDKLIPLMWEFSLLGSLETGSRAISSDKTTLTAVALGSMMDTMCETLNLSAIKQWCRINSVPRWLWPEIAHGDIEKENVLEWVNSVIAAANGGLILTTDNDEKKVREKLGMEQRAPDDELLPRPDAGDGLGGFDLSTDENVEQQLDEPEPEPEPPPPEKPDMLTLEEAEEWMRLPRSTITRAIRSGKLPGGKTGNNYRIPRQALEDYFGMSPSPPTRAR